MHSLIREHYVLPFISSVQVLKGLMFNTNFSSYFLFFQISCRLGKISFLILRMRFRIRNGGMERLESSTLYRTE